MSSGKWRSFCLGLNVLSYRSRILTGLKYIPIYAPRCPNPTMRYRFFPLTSVIEDVEYVLDHHLTLIKMTDEIIARKFTDARLKMLKKTLIWIRALFGVIMEWKRFLHYKPFVRGIHWSPSQRVINEELWMISLLAWIVCWKTTRLPVIGDLTVPNMTWL